MVKLDIVGPHAPQAGQDLCEGCDDQVFAVSGTSRNTLLSLFKLTSVTRLGDFLKTLVVNVLTKVARKNWRLCGLF